MEPPTATPPWRTGPLRGDLKGAGASRAGVGSSPAAAAPAVGPQSRHFRCRFSMRSLRRHRTLAGWRLSKESNSACVKTSSNLALPCHSRLLSKAAPKVSRKVAKVSRASGDPMASSSSVTRNTIFGDNILWRSKCPMRRTLPSIFVLYFTCTSYCSSYSKVLSILGGSRWCVNDSWHWSSKMRLKLTSTPLRFWRSAYSFEQTSAYISTKKCWRVALAKTSRAMTWTTSERASAFSQQPSNCA
mmetsp:Transcript_6966/g.19696  ORF Transcript_6966/g.19696 Transcript_6966/m.19696 type:complete len:244 (+) Transcript_6966:399-1130(+)